jgi:hypothetical protein
MDIEEECEDDIVDENPSTMMAYANIILRYVNNTGYPVEANHCLELK